MKHKFIIAAALAVLMSVSAFATTAYAATSNNQEAVTESSSDTAKNSKHGKKEKVDEPENAIGKDKAKAAISTGSIRNLFITQLIDIVHFFFPSM